MFAGSDEVQPDDWLQVVNTNKSSLNLANVQMMSELPHFLVKEPSKWFKVLSSSCVIWSQFCQLFRKAFLPSVMPFILGMDFLIRALLTIHIPSRIMLMDEVPCPVLDKDQDCTVEPFSKGGTMMYLDTLQLTVM